MSNDSLDPESFRRFVLTQLAEEITATPFKSSIRLIIIMSIGVSKKMRLTDLMKLIGCGKETFQTTLINSRSLDS